MSIAMNKDKYVFSQLTDFLDRFKFRRFVDKYGGDYLARQLTCWNQLLALMFGQLSGRESLRDLVVALEAHRSKCYHLGFGRGPVTRATLSDANQRRDFRIFEEFAFFMMEEARGRRATEIFNLGGNVYAFDSTTIPLCLAVFKWAVFRRRKGGVKLHVLHDLETSVPAFYHITSALVHDSRAMAEIPCETGAFYIFDRAYNALEELYRIHRLESFFVVRAKQNLKYKCVKWRRRLPGNVLGDAEIRLAKPLACRKFPETMRLVRFHDAEQDRDFAFLTNAFSPTAQEIANLYRNRWQVELFFKWLKQHLKIKKFWGTSENAVRIQVSAAIVTYCLVAIVQKALGTRRSTCELLQILSVSLLDKTPLKELCEKAETKEEDRPVTPFLPGFFN